MMLKTRVVRPDAFTAPNVIRTERTTRRELQKLFRQQTAAEFIGTITPGFHIFGLTKGQFSLVDVVREVSNQIGRCTFSLSTWTVADADLGELQTLVNGNRFETIRFLLDFSFQRRQPALIAHIRDTYGPQAVVVTRNHCKFALFGNERFKVVCRTSMNLNFNPRLEDVELKDDPELYGFFEAVLSDLFRRHDPQSQAGKSSKELAAQFSAWGSTA
jgi:hypothetical protein